MSWSSILSTCKTEMLSVFRIFSHSGHSFLPEGNWFLAKANSPFSLLKSYKQSCSFDKKLILSPRLIQNWWTRRKVRQEHGTERKINFPQWEKDYNLQPMNAYGLFDEYLEMSMEICLSFLSIINASLCSLATLKCASIIIWPFM